FIATIAISGRDRNIKILLSSIGAGSTLVALKGIGEYVQIMGEEPSHRIFADWNNPNAVASLFVLGTLVLLGLTAAIKSNLKWLTLAAAGISTTGLILTQSKGGYLAIIVGIVALIIFQLAFKQGKKVVFSLAPLIL